MGVKETLKRLEQQAGAEKELCQHLPPLIERADGTVENESTHNCGRPRLVVTLRYSDGSDKRTLTTAHRAFAKLRQEFSDIPEVVIAERVSKHFCVPSEELLQGARA